MDPSFIVSIVVGGVQKAGTTSLYSYLAQHPRLVPAIVKETHFFDDEKGVDWARPDYASYHSLFPAHHGGRYAFDATPIYIFWPPSLARIRAYNPNTRLIFVFRDPIERAWSHWCMEFARAREDLLFAVAIRQGRARLSGVDRLASTWRVYSYVERGFYASQVRRVLRHFPPEQVLLLRSRDLLNEHQSVLERIASFLKIDAFPSIPARVDNRTPGFTYPSKLTADDVVYLRGLFMAETREFGALTGLRVDDWPVMNPSLDEELCRT